jgi:hypothetical protein
VISVFTLAYPATSVNRVVGRSASMTRAFALVRLFRPPMPPAVAAERQRRARGCAARQGK